MDHEQPVDPVSRRVRRTLAARILRRFLAADGTSHTRALAYETTLLALSGFIGLLGLGSILGAEGIQGVVTELGTTIAPGPSGELLREAARSGARHATTAAVVGLAGAAVAGSLAVAQIERAGNRIGGSDRDRPVVVRYLAAFGLAVTVGLAFAVGALVLGAGRAIPAGGGWSEEFRTAWSITRWPIGVAIVSGAILLLFRYAPRISLGPWPALIAGTVVAVVLWVAFTGLLSLYFALQSDSSPYGPLLSIVALLLWSFLGSLALHLGMSTAVELAAGRHQDGDEVDRLPERSAQPDETFTRSPVTSSEPSRSGSRAPG